MENFDKKIGSMNKTSIIFSIIFMLLGLFLILKPEDAIHLLSYALGMILLIWGLVSIVKFFSNKESQNYLEFSFIVGVFVFIFGVIILIKPNTIANIIPLLLGIWMLINGVTKLSYSLSINRNNPAPGSIIVSGLIIICGILLIFNPFSGAKALTQIIGGTLILYSILDLIECITIKSTVNKKALKEGKIIDAEFKEK